MGALDQPVKNNLDRINHMCRPWQLFDEIHSDLLQFPHGDIQQIHLSVGSLMFILDFLVSQVSDPRASL